MEQVALKNAAVYDPLLISRILSEALSDCALSLPGNARVLIKTNVMSQNIPRQCTTTHPAVVEALCMLLRDNNCRIIIGDSSAYYQKGYTRRGFRSSGIEAVAERYDADLIPFEEDGGVLMENPSAAVLKRLLISRQVLESDYLISAAKLKTHAFAGMSATVKNLFGLIPGGAKYEYHFMGGYTRELFGEKIADLYGLVKPRLFVLDAVRGLEGLGPASTGTPRQTGILMLSDNGYALDYLAAEMIGVDPSGNEILRAGIRRGFLAEPGSISLKGDFTALPSIPYKLPDRSTLRSREDSSFYKIVAVHPVIRESRCTACGLCVQACPLSAIRGGGVPDIDRQSCLNCLYCFYRCPERAITLRGERPFLNRLSLILRRILRL